MNLLVSACVCKQGLRTVDLCAHRTAVLYYISMIHENRNPFDETQNTKFENSIFTQIKDISSKKRINLDPSPIAQKKRKICQIIKNNQNTKTKTKTNNKNNETTLQLEKEKQNSDCNKSDTNTNDSLETLHTQLNHINQPYLLQNHTLKLCHCNVSINLLLLNQSNISIIENNHVTIYHEIVKELKKIKNRSKFNTKKLVQLLDMDDTKQQDAGETLTVMLRRITAVAKSLNLDPGNQIEIELNTQNRNHTEFYDFLDILENTGNLKSSIHSYFDNTNKSITNKKDVFLFLKSLPKTLYVNLNWRLFNHQSTKSANEQHDLESQIEQKKYEKDKIEARNNILANGRTKRPKQKKQSLTKINKEIAKLETKLLNFPIEEVLSKNNHPCSFTQTMTLKINNITRKYNLIGVGAHLGEIKECMSILFIFLIFFYFFVANLRK